MSKKFKLINDEIFPIDEGGKAVHGIPIKREFIEPTLKYFEEKVLKPALGITLAECKTLGSTGRKPESGDIDLGIPFTVACNKEDLFFHHYPYYLDDLHKKVNELCPGTILNLVFNQFHTPFPQMDNENQLTGDICQIDMIFGNLTYLEWSMSSFPDTSQHESWVRNALLSALGRTRIVKQREDMKVVYKTRLSYNTVSGILSKLEYRFKEDHPSSELPIDHLLNIELLSSNPDTVVSLLFDDSTVTADSVHTGEDTINQIIRGINNGTIDEYKFLLEFNNLVRENKKDVPELIAQIQQR